MTGKGSAGKVIAAIASLIIPGLGQLFQGRATIALVMIILAGVMWFFLLGWVIHLWSAIDAAKYKGRKSSITQTDNIVRPT